jgi:hypothetical protein
MAGPALADLTGSGHADVIEPTYQAGNNGNASSAGKLWAFDSAGNPLPGWAGRPSGGGQVLGSVATADLNGDGAQDVVVATAGGVFAYDGRTANELFSLDSGDYFQNTPLITDDGNGAVGITLVDAAGRVEHWRMPAAAHASLGAIGWPMFHHDARHTGNLVPPPLGGSAAAPANAVVGVATVPAAHQPNQAAPASAGEWLARSDGSVTGAGGATSLGAVGHPLARPVVGIAATPSGNGYWLVASDGGIFSFGDATFHGSTGAMRLNQPIVAMAPTASGGGYWFVAADGGVFTFGDATFKGSLGGAPLSAPVVGIAASGSGYVLAEADGTVKAFA